MKQIKVIALFLALSTGLKAQDAMQDAFAGSYVQERAANYKGAAQTIANVYNPASYECNIRLAYLKYMCGEYSDALVYYNKAIVLMPYAIEPRLGIVLPMAALGKWDDVMNQYLAILKIDPKNSSVNYKLGYLYYTRKKYMEAHKYFEKVVNLYPFDYDGLIMYAWTNYRIGRLKEARLLFKKVLLLAPGDKSATEGLSYIK